MICKYHIYFFMCVNNNYKREDINLTVGSWEEFEEWDLERFGGRKGRGI